MMEGKGDGRDHSIIAENIRLRSRFGQMLAAVEGGATMEDMRKRFDGYDPGTDRVLRAILNGTISSGQERYTIKMRVQKAFERELLRRERNEKAFLMFDAGLKLAEIGDALGLSKSRVKQIKASWAVARGLADRKKGA